MECTIYKGDRKMDAYLFVRHPSDISQVPTSLLKLMGTLEIVTSLKLTPNSKLARADPTNILQHIEDYGFYLQLPPLTTQS